MNRNGNNPLVVLEGEQLGAVVFVQDYLQLDFDGSLLTCYNWPIVYTDGRRSEYGDPTYRDDLCAIIAEIVEHTKINKGVSLEIRFLNSVKHSIVVPITDGGKEAAMFHSFKGEWSFFKRHDLLL